MSKKTKVLIIGAGLTGLTAATKLKTEGFEVIVLDKGRGVGGRLASRRIGEATFDHGAQFMTARDPDFSQFISEWEKQGAVTEWFRRTEGSSEAHIRWRGVPSMTGIAKNLAKHVHVQLSTRIVSLELCEDYDKGFAIGQIGWRAQTEAGEEIYADIVILTAPVPQSLSLIDGGNSIIPSDIRASLQAIRYESCIAVMAVLNGFSALTKPGGLVGPSDQIAWIADNYLKGVSKIPAITIHADAAFSKKHWNEDRREIGKNLIAAAQNYLGSSVSEYQVHGWLYSKPVHVSLGRCIATWATGADGPFSNATSGTKMLSGGEASQAAKQSGVRSAAILFAGDAFSGSRVEGAFLSGQAAAAHLINRIS